MVADRRFEALVKKEMLEHQHLISSHNKEMQTLRDALNFSMEKFNSISERNEKQLIEFKDATLEQIASLKEKILTMTRVISAQKETIEDLNEQLLVFHEIYSGKDDIEKFKKEMSNQIKESTEANLNSFQNCQLDLKILLQHLKDDLIKLNLDMDYRFSALEEKCKNDFSIFRIDKESVLRELKFYKKDLFVIEKKIENIYTLIERINKKGDKHVTSRCC